MEAFLSLIVFVAIVAFLLWQLVLRLRGGTTTVRTEGAIHGPGDFACEVVGESKYQHHLERIAGGRTEDSAELRKKAVLALEDDNPHDKNAVCVRIDGLRVGYLPRTMAKMYRKRLAEKNAPIGHYWCEAIIVGGWDRGDDRGHFGVRLDLPIEGR
jgi:hypothetical protein